MLEGNKWIVTGADKQGVSDYLSSGGHLLIHGGEIGFGLSDAQSTDQDKTFMKDVLHASYVKDSAGPRTVLGVTDDIISGPFSTTPVNIYGVTVDNPNQPDEIKPENWSRLETQLWRIEAGHDGPTTGSAGQPQRP